MKHNQFRWLIIATLCVLAGLMLLACTDPTVQETTAPDTVVTDVPTAAPTDTPTDTPTEEATTEEETTLAPLEWESYDPALDNSAVDQSATHVVKPDQWIAQDGLDRVISTYEQTGEKREDKIVAMFYWT